MFNKCIWLYFIKKKTPPCSSICSPSFNGSPVLNLGVLQVALGLEDFNCELSATGVSLTTGEQIRGDH